MKLHQAVAEALKIQGTTVVFGLIGDGNLFSMHSFAGGSGARFIGTAHESGAVLAANGYAQSLRCVGVASVTQGPGLTNTVTALVESVRDRTPLVLITADTPASLPQASQRLSQRELVESTGSAYIRLEDPNQVWDLMSHAFCKALEESRPVVLSIVADLQWSEVETEPTSTHQSAPPVAHTPTSDEMDAALGVIASSRRPVVLAGRGVASEAAKDAVVSFAEQIGAPLATTLRARELFRGLPFDVGIFGTLTTEIGLDVIEASDCIIAFGAGLNRLTTGDGALVKDKAVIQVDTSDASINRWVATTAHVQGDAATVAGLFSALLSEGDVQSTGFAEERLAQLTRDAALPTRAATSPENDVDVRTAFELVEANFPSDRVVVMDVGRFVFSALPVITVPDPARYLHAMNFGSIGLGMGNAIGASVAFPDSAVLLGVGDGGFMLGGLGEFNTAVRYGLNIVVVLINDSSYGAEYVQLLDRGLDASISSFDWPNFAEVARSLGGQGITVTNYGEMEKVALELESLSRRGPVLIDVRVDPAQVASGTR